MMKKHDICCRAIAAVFFCLYSTVFATLSPEVLALKTALQELKRKRQEAAQSTADDKIKLLLDIRGETTNVLKQLIDYWPAIKQELSGPCESTYTKYKEGIKSCCSTIPCQTLADKSASNETKLSIVRSLEECKIKEIPEDIRTSYKECLNLIEFMFEASMQIGGNKTIRDELKPYTSQYWGSGKK